MAWDERMKDFHARRAKARGMGGPENVPLVEDLAVVFMTQVRPSSTYPIRREAVQTIQALSLKTAQEIAKTLIEDFMSEKVDAVYVAYNEFKSIIAQRVIVERLLPIERAWDEVGTEVDYLYEPGPEQILNELLPKHIEFQLYRILLESAASEQGARMTAMRNASGNAGDLISSLTLDMNRARQAEITQEILEVVAGADALAG